MTEINTFQQNIKRSVGIRLLILFGSFVFLIVLSSIIGSAIRSSGLNQRASLLLSSGIQCVLAFCLPAWLLGRYISDHPFRWLDMSRLPSLRAIVGVIIVYVISLPAMNVIIEWNANMHFPSSMAAIEEVFRGWEESNEAISRQLLTLNSIWDFLASLLIVGVMAGISEEMFFRGAFQKIISESYLGIIAAIWIGAFVFSTFHFQFFGFIPRLLMGAFFGYLLYWTRNLWVAIFAHVLNNSIVVVWSAISSDNMANYENIGLEEGFPILGFTSMILTIGFILLFKTYFFRWQRKQQ